ncbi:MAG: diguanylate cyclase [Acidimicrobiia bacterium]|nr:diguanylate cyclase [Acidimicrobiia bacterium]
MTGKNLTIAITTRLASLAARVLAFLDREPALDRAHSGVDPETHAAIFTECATSYRGDWRHRLNHPSMQASLHEIGSGLLDKQFFEVILQQRVATARRTLQPMSIILFELDDHHNVKDFDDRDRIGVLGETILRTLRECDIACQINDSIAAIILEDTAESDAVWAAERVRGSLFAITKSDSLTVSAGIACYPSHALYAPELVRRATDALTAALLNGRDRVEVAAFE